MTLIGLIARMYGLLHTLVERKQLETLQNVPVVVEDEEHGLIEVREVVLERWPYEGQLRMLLVVRTGRSR